MSATNRTKRHRGARPCRRRAVIGASLVEFALIALAFFTLLFLVMETARALYLWNTLQEVTRRAAYGAAATDFSDSAAMLAVRQAALMNGTGALPLGAPVTQAYIRIDYMSLTRASDGSMTLTAIPTASLPACPPRAKLNCTADPNGASCIRFVRARVCHPDSADGDCDPVPYQSMVGLTTMNMSLPPSTTISKAESLGFQPGDALCP